MRRPTILPTFIAFVCQLQVQSLQILTSQWFLVIAKQSKCHHPTRVSILVWGRYHPPQLMTRNNFQPSSQTHQYSPIKNHQQLTSGCSAPLPKTFPKWYRYLSLLNRSTDLNCTCWTAPAVAGVRGLFAQGLAWRSDCKSSLVGSSSPNRLFQGRRTFEDSKELETVGNHPTCLFILFSWAQTVGNKRSRHGSLELNKTPFEHTQRSMPKPNLEFSDSVQEHSNMTSTSDHVPRKLHQVSLSFPMTRAVWWSFLHGAESPNSDSTISWSLVLPDMGNMHEYAKVFLNSWITYKHHGFLQTS